MSADPINCGQLILLLTIFYYKTTRFEHLYNEKERANCSERRLEMRIDADNENP